MNYELFLDWLYPPYCVHCGGCLFGHRAAFLCAECEAQMTWIKAGACKFCGEPAGIYAQLSKGCRRCNPHQSAFTRAVAATKYRATPAESLIKKFKYAGNYRLAQPLAQAMLPSITREISSAAVEGVLPVPLHPDREALRGYNQAALLAKIIAKNLQLPYHDDLLRRVRNTPAQAQLSVTERKTNLQDAFIAPPILPLKKVLLIDDVLTTGATADECARALRRGGASRIYVAVFAR